jgi:flagellar capping protein FliD
MIESTSLFRDMGLKSIPTLAFIATFYWFNTQMQASVSLLSEKIESTNLRIDTIDQRMSSMNQRIDDSRALSKAQFELLSSKVTMYQEATNSQLQEVKGRITRIEDKLTQVIEHNGR